jgi:nucleoid-associated protein YgaU
MSGETEQRINYIRKLIADAEKLGANEYAKEDLNNAISELEKGVNYHQNKDKENTKISLDAAEKSALKAIELTKAALKEKKRKEALKAIMDAGKTVEDASKKKVINEEGEAEKSSDYKFEFDEGKKDLNRAPDTGMSYKDLLNKAIDYVEKAKEAYRNEDYELAIHYAQLAKKIAENYQGGGIKLYYTVRLIPERRDCLWRISEYPEIYNDPFLWPMIWKANKREILNPDLIFPGQVFAVPDVD